MAALLVALSVMAVLMSAALPVWSQQAQREKEEELIWRGQQYARAIGLFQRKYANTFPPNIDILVEQRFLRKKYKDPITNDDFQPIPAGGAALGAAPGQIQTAGAPGPTQLAAPSGRPTATVRPPTQTTPQTTATAVAGGVTGGQVGAGRGPNQPSIGIQGVVSKSTETSIKTYNGRNRYNEWAFVHVATAQRIGPGGVQRPGVGPQGQPQPGRPAIPMGPGGMPGGPGIRPPGPMQPGQSPFGPFGQPPGQPPPQRPPGG